VVWREIDRNQSPDGIYYATRAHQHAHQVRRRPKTPILARNSQLAGLLKTR
jgi:IS30 family transposase